MMASTPIFLKKQILPGLILLLCSFFLAACRTTYTKANQDELIRLYEANDLSSAAGKSMEISDSEAEEDDREALLWHLEAGSINLDAGRTEASMKALERAEKLLYLYDEQGRMQAQKPGQFSYKGYRLDRITLNMLKFFNYFSRDEFEDALVEIRRMRNDQFRYVLRGSDPSIRQYDAENEGKKVYTKRLNDLLKDALNTETFGKMELSSQFEEYSELRRPRYSMLYNPLAFYLSAVGYYWDDDYSEALVDLRYLWQMQPENPLYRRDYVTLLRLCGDPVPDELREVKSWDHPLNDQQILVLFAQNRPAEWRNKTAKFQLPNMVPATWTYCYPGPSADAFLRVRITGSDVNAETCPLANIDRIVRDEYWQLMLPDMLGGSVAAIKNRTAAHEAAKANLELIQASPNYEGKAFALAAAQLAVNATKDITINNSEWRRWSTIAQEYQAMHVRIPQDRKLTFQVLDSAGKPVFDKTLAIEPDANRVIVYIREINGSFYLKKWESLD